MGLLGYWIVEKKVATYYICMYNIDICIYTYIYILINIVIVYTILYPQACSIRYLPAMVVETHLFQHTSTNVPPSQYRIARNEYDGANYGLINISGH
jgi:hypothetical protein